MRLAALFLPLLALSVPVMPVPAWAEPLHIVFLGDSLTDGYGISREKAYPALIDQKLEEAGFADVQVVNAGISGSTTAGADKRLEWHLKSKVDILVLALGANDGLRGFQLEQTRKNLSKVIERAKVRGVEVLLAGMKLPPNYGKAYVRGFEKLYQDLAREHQVALVPFLLEGVGGEKELNLQDGIHPNELGHKKMAETVFPHLLKLIQKRK